MDILARAPLKGAAKRDSLCELQNSVNRWPPERALRSRDFLRAGLLQCLALSTCACKQHVCLHCCFAFQQVIDRFCVRKWLVCCLAHAPSLSVLLFDRFCVRKWLVCCLAHAPSLSVLLFQALLASCSSSAQLSGC